MDFNQLQKIEKSLIPANFDKIETTLKNFDINMDYLVEMSEKSELLTKQVVLNSSSAS